ncbi:MAG: HEAT repeat domain-containing protein [Planctomycetota bacterium]
MGTESEHGRDPKKRPHSPDTGESSSTSVEGWKSRGLARVRTPAPIESLLRGLMVCARMLILYPPGHGRVQRKLAEIQGLLGELFAERSDPLELTVFGHRLAADGVPCDDVVDVAERFALLLRHRQIRTILFLPGVEESEVQLIVEVLRIDHRALLRVGGTRSFVDQRPHPHVKFLLHEGDAGRPTGQAPEDADELGGEVALAGPPAPEEGPPQRVLVDTEGNVRLTVEDEPPESVGPGQEPASEQERFEQQLEEFALKDLLESPTDERGEANEAVAFSVEDDLLSDEEVRSCMQDDARTLKQRFRRHVVEESALCIIFRMLAEAADETQYRQRRRMLLQVVRDPRFFTGELVHVVHRLVEDGGTWGFERGEELAQSVIAYVTDAAAVSQLLNSIPLVPEVAQGVLSSLADREDALPLLARLITTDLPEFVAADLPKTLVQVSESNAHGFVQWALQDRNTVLRPTVVKLLLESCPTIFTPVCERLLLERPDRDRRKLLHLLCANGSENALRLLASAVRACGRGVAVEALEALGRFPHPLSLEVLREVIQRNNGDAFERTEAEAAIFSLYSLGINEARTFLWAIVQARRSLFSYAYVRPLRLIAESVLQGPETL